MTTQDLEQIGKLLDAKLEPLRQDVSTLKGDVSSVKENVSTLKQDLLVN